MTTPLRFWQDRLIDPGSVTYVYTITEKIGCLMTGLTGNWRWLGSAPDAPLPTQARSTTSACIYTLAAQAHARTRTHERCGTPERCQLLTTHSGFSLPLLCVDWALVGPRRAAESCTCTSGLPCAGYSTATGGARVQIQIRIRHSRACAVQAHRRHLPGE